LLNAGKSLTIEVTSHGERNPLVQTPDNTAEPKNRRVEVTVR
jgi:outer membrane protein OmpA-like peptidoglycan-associated protein